MEALVLSLELSDYVSNEIAAHALRLFFRAHAWELTYSLSTLTLVWQNVTKRRWEFCEACF